jgi:hypothetical protein
MSSGNEGEASVNSDAEIVEAEIVNEEVVPLEEIPVVLHQGRYRLYQKPDGGLRLQYKRDDSDAEDHIELPGVLVRLLNKAQQEDMSPMDFMRAMMSLKRNHGV